MTIEELDIQLPALKVKIPYDEDIFETTEIWTAILTDILNESKSIYMETKYPYEDFSGYLLPTRYYNWQLRCSVELYNLADKTGLTNYTENGIAWSKLSDGLSNELMWKINSKVGIPKFDETITSDSESL